MQWLISAGSESFQYHACSTVVIGIMHHLASNQSSTLISSNEHRADKGHSQPSEQSEDIFFEVEELWKMQWLISAGSASFF